jgi:hypothetical protein
MGTISAYKLVIPQVKQPTKRCIIMNLLKTIKSDITKVKNAEKVTKERLGNLSRNLLSYVYVEDSQDITQVNNLLAVLTPQNKRVATLFFKTFLSWSFDKDTGLFKKKNKKKYEEFKLNAELFLANEESNIWTWAANNVTTEKKPVDWTARLTKDVSKALESGLTFNEIMSILNNAVAEDTPKAA